MSLVSQLLSLLSCLVAKMLTVLSAILLSKLSRSSVPLLCYSEAEVLWELFWELEISF